MRPLRDRLGLPNRGPAHPGFPIVDAHHHLWDLGAVRYPWLTDEIEPYFMFGDYAELRRNYLPTDYLADSARQNVVATVHCEAESDRTDPVQETRWLAWQHAHCGFPNALVVWADLASAHCAAQLEAHLEASPLVRGVRCKPRLPAPGSDAPVPGGIEDPAFVQWRKGMHALAALPNVCVKISELGLADQAWSWSDNVPIIRETIAIFGPDRALFASNFPVAGMRVDYDTWVGAVTEALEGAGPDEREKIFSRNALRVYRIATTDTPTGAIPEIGREEA